MSIRQVVMAAVVIGMCTGCRVIPSEAPGSPPSVEPSATQPSEPATPDSSSAEEAAAPGRQAGETIAVREIHEVTVRAGDENGAMIDEPVDAVDGQGQRIHEFGLRVKGACVLKAYGAGGAGQNTRLLAAPEDYPRGGADRLMVTLRSEQGATKEVEVPITVLPPTEHGAGWGDHAPAARTQRPVSSGSSEGFAVQSPAEGEAVHGLRHTASGTGRPGQKVACTVITKDGTPWVQGESTVEQDGTWRLAYQTGEGPVGVGEDFDVVAKSGGEIRHARVHRKD